MRFLLREPLVHFLALSGLLFLLHAAVVGKDTAFDDERRIVVDRDALLTFIQYRTREFEPEQAEAELASLSEEELQQVINSYITEQALSREARALGLDQTDYIITRRLVQSLEFIAGSMADANVEPSEEEVAAYYAANPEDFFVAPRVSFAHAFISGDGRKSGEAMALAELTLEELRARNVDVKGVAGYSERFLYGAYFVNRSRVHIENQFGAEFADAVFDPETPVREWQGPHQSEHGAHVLFIESLDTGVLPPLEDVMERATELTRSALAEIRTREVVRGIVDRYQADIRYPEPGA